MHLKKERIIFKRKYALKRVFTGYQSKLEYTKEVSSNDTIKAIEKRNKKVEMDKAWETSMTRKICIMVLTYIVVIMYSYIIKKYDNILLSSLVPVIGFTLSTLSLKLIRNIWESKRN